MTGYLHPLQMNRAQRRAALARSQKGNQDVPADIKAMTPHARHAGELVAQVLSGEIDGYQAVDRAHRQLAPMMPKMLFEHGATPNMVHEALDSAWERNSARVINIEKREYVLKLFRYAAFEIPQWIPDTVECWRGSVGLTVEQARRGWSWTLKRGVACHFALGQWQKQGMKGRPLVLKREINRADLVYWNPRIGVAEIVFDAAPAGEVDGDVDDWRASRIELYRGDDDIQRTLDTAEGKI